MYVTHVISFTRLSCFSRAKLKSWEEPWSKANSPIHTLYMYITSIKEPRSKASSPIHYMYTDVCKLVEDVYNVHLHVAWLGCKSRSSIVQCFADHLTVLEFLIDQREKSLFFTQLYSSDQ